MDNPLEQPRPDNVIEQVHALAYDLAYGVKNGMWDAEFFVMRTGGGDFWSIKGESLHKKWENGFPDPALMITFQYLESPEPERYRLTQKAFALPESQKTQSAFISYFHATSSALALLVEVWLKSADPNIDIFTDKRLKPGKEWEDSLKAAIEQSSTFISLIAPGSLDSEMVRKEIQRAKESGRTIILILHNGCTISGTKIVWEVKTCENNELVSRTVEYEEPALTRIQAIPVKEESVDGYSQALVKLLDALGYSEQEN